MLTPTQRKGIVLIDEAIKVTKKLCVQIQCPSSSSIVSHQPAHSEKKKINVTPVPLP